MHFLIREKNFKTLSYKEKIHAKTLSLRGKIHANTLFYKGKIHANTHSNKDNDVTMISKKFRIFI